MVALDVDSGKMRWHFQFTPHDVHDWDANQIPVLVDRTIDGRATARVAMANRNGFFYLLDRRSGEFLLARQYAKQTWAEAIDPRGRPIVIPGMEPSEKGTLVYPSLQGATNWASPSFSPLTGLMYVAVREMGSVYFKSDVEYRPGTYYTGGSEKRLDDESWGSIRALNIDTGATVWDFKLPSPPWGGVLSTAGGLVFAGSNEGQRVRPRRQDRRPVVAVPGGRSHAREPDVVLGEGTSTRRRRCGTRLRCLCLAGAIDASFISNPSGRLAKAAVLRRSPKITERA